MLFHAHAGSDPRFLPLGRTTSDAAVAFARLVAARRLHPEVAVTCRGRSDGAGQQAIAVVSAMMLARYAGCRYCHTPFARMSHAEGSREDWAARWERFFNLGDGEAPVPLGAELVTLSAVVADPAAHADRPVVVAEPVFHLPHEAAAAAGESLRADLRARYWRSPKDAIASHRAPSGLTIAIHLRRGDVDATRNAHRYVRDEDALRQIARLRQALAPFGQPLTLNLYSEGEAGDFAAFAEAGCALHIGGDAFETLHNLAIADFLMGASSNFSYIAALISRGIMLDSRARRVPLSDWIRRNRNHDIPIGRVRRALARRLSWPARCVYRLRLWLQRLARLLGGADR
jgi:hypothetical protein